MQYSVLISKIRCKSPNKKGTAVHNKNAIHYMATRSGVDLTPIPDDHDKSGAAAHNRNAIHYMATRSGVDLTPSEVNTEFLNSPELSGLMDEEKKLAAMSSETYLKYLTEHSTSHGLFGNIPVNDLQQVEKDVYKIASKKIYTEGLFPSGKVMQNSLIIMIRPSGFPFSMRLCRT